MLLLEREPHHAHRLERHVGTRRAGDDSVIVARIILHFLERLPPAARAAEEIGVIDRPGVMEADQPLGGDGGEMDGAMLVIDPRLGIGHPPRIGRLMPGIGGDGGEALADAQGHVAIVEDAGVPPDAGAEQPSVPVGRQP
jgi:hypothetical protein